MAQNGLKISKINLKAHKIAIKSLFAITLSKNTFKYAYRNAIL